MKTYKVKEGNAKVAKNDKEIEITEAVNQTITVTKAGLVAKAASLKRQLDDINEEIKKVDEALKK